MCIRDSYERLLRWLVDPGEKRTVAPASDEMLEAVAGEYLQSPSEAMTRQGYYAAPWHPLAGFGLLTSCHSHFYENSETIQSAANLLCSILNGEKRAREAINQPLDKLLPALLTNCLRVVIFAEAGF